MRRLFLSFCLVFSFVVGGCSEKDPQYCDSETPCGGGQVCDVARRTCVTTADAGGEGNRGNGSPCSKDDRCASGFCVDGVCCDSRCEGTCRSCALPTSPGTCATAPSGQDPRASCAAAVAACSGTCDGSGGCAYPDATQECAPPSCAAGMLSRSRCDGKGGCGATSVTCGGYACTAAGDACKTTCTSAATDCTGTFQCVGNSCVNQLPNGSDCGTNDKACASTHCVDGVCCGDASCPTCKACNVSGKLGACSAVTDGTTCGAATCAAGSTSTPTCTSGSCAPVAATCAPYLCNAAGTNCATSCGGTVGCATTGYCDGTQCKPKKANGTACGAAAECTSGVCTATEKVCCDSACAGDCETCAGKSACTAKIAGTPCGTKKPFCDDQPTTSAVKTQQCDSKKACLPVVVIACDPYRCAGTTPACTTSCAANANCTTGVCDLAWTKATCPATGAVCYADVKTCPSTGAGTRASPYCKIQSCLDALRPYVVVADGTYVESLTVTSKAQIVSSGTTGLLHTNGVPQSGVAKVLLRPDVASAPGILVGAKLQLALYGLDVQPKPASSANGDLVQLPAGGDLWARTCHLGVGKNRGVYLNNNTAGTSSMILDDVAVDGCAAYGVESVQTSVTISRSSVQLNGGGVQVDKQLLTMTDSLVAFNFGDGVLCWGVGVDLDRVKIGANSGWGVRLQNGSTCFIADTQVNNNGKGGVLMSNNPTSMQLTLLYSTLANNTGKELQCDSSPLGIAYGSILWDDNNSDIWSGDCKFGYSDVKRASGVEPGSANINADPKFDTTNTLHPYSLLPTSPCIDVGNDGYPGKTLDLVGKPRHVDKIPGGTITDIGAFEVQ
jgi:hypothetical protein